ncbi:helix-turn-helix domain-containing protein [Streptomyces sp. SID5785]|uniref:AraC family transcriptional regulator n=1 Tax=Streptomyces sp. SID5785 TaxID=2690309 RepID=UPI001360FA8B|nr:AraC family transcriptional regulator [Streptomyces sp. SID5785]MZD09916.1 helix-turn-helix domain-containing protein [Streptomyces sp. SID5785]
MDVVSDAITAVRAGRPVTNRLRIDGGWCVRLDPYEGAGFHVVLAGTCWLLPDGGAPVTLRPGDAVLLPHGAGHVLADAPRDPAALARAVPFDALPDPPPAPAGQDADPVELLCGKYRLDRSRTHPLLTELPDVVHLPDDDGHHPELRAAVGLLAREVEQSGPGSCAAVPSLLDLLLVYMIRAWTTGPAGRATGRWPAALADPVVTEALRLLHTDPALPWTADRLAARAGVSRATLGRRFTALVGRPPMAYLTWWRMTLAATALRTADTPLESVARDVGYGSPYALSHAFRRAFGTTPGRYRAARRPAPA